MITLPADVFDTLDLVAHIYGGVGAATDYEWDGVGPYIKPCCIHGLAYHAAEAVSLANSDLGDALYAVELSRNWSDQAVRAINARKGASPHARVDFITEWCPELNVVRGE